MPTEQQLIDEIQRLADGDTPPTSREMDADGRFWSSTYGLQFGSWNNAVEAAGFQVKDTHNTSATELLTDLQTQADGIYPPLKQNYGGSYTTATFQRRFGSWWQAVVRAGLQPQKRNPLTPRSYDRFHRAALDQQSPLNELISLLFQFTGLPRRILAKLSSSWIKVRDEDVIITVPSDQTPAGDRWVFRLPETWNYNGTEKQTELPGLTQWYFDRNSSINKTGSTCRDTLYRTAEYAGLSDVRRTVDRQYVGTVPAIAPSDLRTTSGVHLARAGAPPRRIRRHLGIEHTNWPVDVEDFFLWLYVHEDYTHPDYSPPDVVLDPVHLDASE